MGLCVKMTSIAKEWLSGIGWLVGALQKSYGLRRS